MVGKEEQLKLKSDGSVGSDRSVGFYAPRRYYAEKLEKTATRLK